ncbi:MarR family winged helix-turn-helix transcriptional regulator [Sorangium sp. So ce131]|uniref:MarR family winged helix-turn-helix transcriptional regulator n=1 Tax=Sorangium sp. So ce131 TaxID=3133282 RepID=UPI003F620C34
MAAKRASAKEVKELVDSLGDRLGRELSTQSVLLHQAIAERLGLKGTDHKYLDVLRRAAEAGPVTPGDLVQLTGLTSGGVTGVLDRLEAAGFVRRVKHPSDRRQLVIEPVTERYAEIGALFAPFRERWAVLCARYSLDELRLICDFFEHATALMAEEIARMQRPAGPPEATPASAPPRDAARAVRTVRTVRTVDDTKARPRRTP